MPSNKLLPVRYGELEYERNKKKNINNTSKNNGAVNRILGNLDQVKFQPRSIDFLLNGYTAGQKDKNGMTITPQDVYNMADKDKKGNTADNLLRLSSAQKYINSHPNADWENLADERDEWTKKRNNAENILKPMKEAEANIADGIKSQKIREHLETGLKPKITTRDDQYNDFADHFDRLLYDEYYGNGAYDREFNSTNRITRENAYANLRELWADVDSGAVEAAANKATTLRKNSDAYDQAKAEYEYAQKQLKSISAREEAQADYNDLIWKYSDMEKTNPNYVPEYDKGGFVYSMANIESGVQTSDVNRIYSFLGHGKDWQEWVKWSSNPDGSLPVTSEYNYAMMMTDGSEGSNDEVGIFMNLYNQAMKEGRQPEEAKAFLDGLQTALRARYSMYEDIRTAETARQLPVLTSTLSVLLDQANAYIAPIRHVAHALGDKSTEDPNSAWYSGAKQSDIIKETVKNQIGGFGGKLYERVIDSVSNIYRGLTTPGTSRMAQTMLGLGQFFAQVDQEATARYLKNNNYATASRLGAIDAMFEVVEEFLPYETMLGSVGKNVAWAMVENGLAELGQEFTGATVFEKIKGIMTGEDSEQARVNEIFSNGYYIDRDGNEVELSKNRNVALQQARTQAAKEYWTNAVESGLAGMFGGTLGGTYGTIATAMGQYSVDKATGQRAANFNIAENATAEERTTGQAINRISAIEMARKMPVGTESQRLGEELYQKLQGKKTTTGEGQGSTQGGKRITDAEYGKLVRAILADTDESVHGTIKGLMGMEIEARLRSMNEEEKNVKPLASSLVNLIAGTYTDADLARIMTSKNSTLLLTEYRMGDKSEFGKKAAEAKAQTAEMESIRETVEAMVTPKTELSVEKIIEVTKDAPVASEEEIRQAGGKKNAGPRSAVTNGMMKEIAGVETVNNEDGKGTHLQINFTDGTTADIADVKATDQQTARVLEFARLNKNKTTSDNFTNILLQHMDGATDAAKMISGATRIRWDVLLGKKTTNSGLDAETVTELREAAEADMEAKEKERVANFRQINPGKGRTMFRGVAYGTNGFTAALKGLSRVQRAEAVAIGAIAKSAGFDVELINDPQNTAKQGNYNASGGIVINLAGTQNKNMHRSAIATFAHEITHWIEGNSPQAYKELRTFVMNMQENSGLNLEQRLGNIMDIYAKEGIDLDMYDAVAELVAKSSEEVLTDEKVIVQLQNEYPNTFSKIRNAVGVFVDRIRGALGMAKETSSIYAQTIREYAGKLSDLWLKGYEEAKNRTGETVKENGMMQASFQEEDTEKGSLPAASSVQAPELTSKATDGSKTSSNNISNKNGNVKGNSLDLTEEEQQLDDEYLRAIKSGDTKKQLEMLRKKVHNTKGIYPFYAPHMYKGDYADLTLRIKKGDIEAIRTAAKEMAEFVPDQAVLIPMPNHTGKVADDTDTMLLAKEISSITGKPIINALQGNERKSRFLSKKNGKYGITAEEMGFKQAAEIPEGKIPIVIDNVVAVGETAKAAIDALNNADSTVLSYTKGTTPRFVKGLKAAYATYEENGEPVQYHDKIRPDINSWRHSIQEDENYMQAVENEDMETQQRIVQEAARAAGYTDRVYHGSDNFGFTKFDMGGSQGQIFVAYDPKVSRTYAGQDSEVERVNNVERVNIDIENSTIEEINEAIRKVGGIKDTNGSTITGLVNTGSKLIKVLHKDGHQSAFDSRERLNNWLKAKFGGEGNEINLYKGGKGVYEFFAKPGKQLVVNANGSRWNNIYLSKARKAMNTREIAEWAKKRGYDSVRINDVYDNGGRIPWMNGHGDVGIFFNESDVKSADPIVYDDNGKVIPPGERFNSDKNDIRWSIQEDESQLYNDLESAREAERQARDRYREILNSEEYKRLESAALNAETREEKEKTLDDLIKFQKETGLAGMQDEIYNAEQAKQKAQRAYDNFIDERDLKEEQDKIAASGMKEAEWRRKQAINQYGYTADFREAGYLLPNGKMLNFTGSKGQHYGMRGNDHRDIGIIYAVKQGSEAMNAFMADGNIRVMAETPGVDIITEPTTEQYNMIRRMAQRFAREEYFSVDFSDARGNNIDSIEYDGTVNPSRIVNDIRKFFKTGSAPQQSVVSQFHDTQWSIQEDESYMQAVNSGDMEAAQKTVDDAATAHGYTIRAFHGTGRADRVGTVFLPERATSGPMAFFTDSRDIAENYAKDKLDTSIAYDDEYGDYYNQFRIIIRGKNVPVGKLWNTLSFAERQKITEAAKHITLDDEAEEIIYDKNAQYGVGNFNDYERKLHGWNSIDTLIDGWLESGTLWNREGDFLKVLELAGIKGATWNNPDARVEKVYDTYLNIQKPFVVNDMYSEEFLDGLQKWWDKQDHSKYEHESMGADFWDKNSISVDEWIEDARRDIENGTTHQWTRIPDGVTAYLQSEGYDGIKDQGGKGGGAGHTVWIPFSSEQIKSAEPVTYDDQGNIIPPSERFNPQKKDIRWSLDDESEGEIRYWLMSVKPESLQTEAERQLLANYKNLQTRVDLRRRQEYELKDKIAALEKKEKLEDGEKKLLARWKIELQNAQNIKQQAEEELGRIVGTEGYARLMRQQARRFEDFQYGKTQAEVNEEVTNLQKSAEKLNELIEENRKRAEEIESRGMIGQLKKILGTTTADQTAAELKKEFHSSWTKTQIRNYLDPILIKLAAGEDISSDVEELAGILVESDERNTYEALAGLRGLTITLGKGAQKELKAQNSSLKEIRSRLAGTGITVKYGDRSTLEADIENLREQYPGMPDFGSDKDALENFVSWVEGMKRSGAEEYYDERLAEAMAQIMGKVAATAQGIYVPTEAKAQKQILALIDFVKGLNAETQDAVNTLQQIADQATEIWKGSGRAAGLANVLTTNISEALEYYDTTAKMAIATAKKERNNQIIDQLKSQHAQEIAKRNEEWRELIERDKDARRTAEDIRSTRSRINTSLKRLYNLLKNPKGLNNIPEFMQGTARELLGIFVNNDLDEYRKAKLTLADRGQLEEAKRLLTEWEKQDGPFRPEELNAAEDSWVRMFVMQDLTDIRDGIDDLNRDYKGKNRLDTLQHRAEILQRIQEAASEIYSAIRAEGKVQMRDRQIAVEDAAYNVAQGTQGKQYKEFYGKAGNVLRMMQRAIVTGNMTPEYFFRMLGNAGLSELWDNYHEAENRNGLELKKAQARLAEIAEKYGYRNWDLKQKITLKLESGDVEVTLGQLMSLWATWKRENTLGPAMSEHLTKGGFFAEQDTRDGFLGRKVMERRAHRVSVQTDESGKVTGSRDMALVESLLSDEQLKFIDDVVSYMSNEMSQLGNEASMAAYGIKLYKEKYYFPFQMWDGVKSRKSNEAGGAAAARERGFHPSFSKSRLHGANNAIVIGDFMQTAADHIAGMINYATMGLADNTLEKVLNQQTSEDAYGTKRNVRTILQEAYGAEAIKYLNELQEQLNGGAVRIEKTFYDKLISLFRKNAVAGSLSVALQQPLSYIRAATMISPKYLARAIAPDMWKGSYAEMLAHSGVAVIKDMGRFDMNFGQSAREFLQPDAKEKAIPKAWHWIEEKSTILPTWADRMTWTRMWSAVKAEQAAQHPKMDTKSDEFLDMVGERFNDIMRRTQVYDSVLVRSANMRSQYPAVKSLTSFMAEPTLTLNVLADSVRMAKNKEKGGIEMAAKAGATFILSAIAQAAIKGLMGSGRTPDEKKTWEENFLYRFEYNFLNEADPLQLIPGFSDLVTVLKGGELKDDAYGTIKKMIDAYGKFGDILTANWYRGVEDSVGQLAQLYTGLPMKNLMRDARAMWNWFIDHPYAERETSGAVKRGQFKDLFWNADNLFGVINNWLGEAGYKTTNKGYYQQIYQAKKAGDTQKAEDMIEYLLKGKGVKQTAIDTGIAGAAKKDDSASAAEKADFLIGEGSNSADNYIKDQLREGNMTAAEARAALQKAQPKKSADDVWWQVDRIEYQLQTGAKEAPSGEYYRLWDAMDANKVNDIKSAASILTQHGKKKEDIRDAITRRYKSAYLAAKGNEKVRIKNALLIAYKAIGISDAEANKIINKWK